jgi:hypothetical protein
MGRTYDADKATAEVRSDVLEVKLDGRIYCAEVPTIGQQFEIAKLLGDKPTDKMADGEVVKQQLNGIIKQLQMLLWDKGKGKDNKTPPPKTVLDKLPVKVAGSILRAINEDSEDESGNSEG